MYIQPAANVTNASVKIHQTVQQLETQSPDSVKLIMGDFISCDLKAVTPTLPSAYIDIPTRRDQTLHVDKCYGNIIKACKSYAKSGLSDHDTVHLVPVYKQILKQEKPQVK